MTGMLAKYITLTGRVILLLYDSSGNRFMGIETHR